MNPIVKNIIDREMTWFERNYEIKYIIVLRILIHTYMATRNMLKFIKNNWTLNNLKLLFIN